MNTPVNLPPWDGSVTTDVCFAFGRPALVGGPCMLESLEMGLEVGSFLKELCARHNIPFVFKSSYDKANRTSGSTARGPGLDQGLQWLDVIKNRLNVPILTDVHTPLQVREAAQVASLLQIPAFLCEQRALVAAAAETGLCLQIKRGQHTSPEQLLQVSAFAKNHGGHTKVLLCERGSSFGYNNLVVDFRALALWRSQGERVVFDATHATQLPGAQNGSSGGMRTMALPLARAACAVGVHGLFLEVHPNPERALSDAGTQLSFALATELIASVRPLCAAAHGGTQTP